MNRPGLFSLAAGLSLASPALAGAAVGIGDVFPPLVSAGLAGGTLPDTAGKVVLVDFWASWCAPCKASFPAYGRLNAEFAPRGLVIVAVSVDEDASAYESFVRKFSPPFLVALDKGQNLVRAVQVPTMPTSYLIDRKGRVRYAHPGFRGAATEQALRREIEALLSDKTP
jgi:thiol-disulfide isomerase/thioredoxin